MDEGIVKQFRLIYEHFLDNNELLLHYYLVENCTNFEVANERI